MGQDDTLGRVGGKSMQSTIGLAARTDRACQLLACWALFAGLAQAAWLIEPWLAAAPALLGALAMPAVFRDGAWRLGAPAVALTSAAVPLAPAAAWIAASAAAAVALSLRGPVAEGDATAELSRHLERSRREGLPAYVFVAEARGEHVARAQHVRDLIRVADSVQLVSDESGHVIRGVVNDVPEFHPEGLEARLARELDGELAIGWARFPEAGTTLERLLEHAAADLRASDARAAGPGRSPARPILAAGE